MVGDGVDGVWGTGGVMFEEELAIIPFVSEFSLISLSPSASFLKSFCCSTISALTSSKRFMIHV